MKRRRASGRSAPALKHAALVVACGAAFIASAWSPRAQAAAANGASADSSASGFVEFDRGMLPDGGKNAADIARFEHGNPVLPGSYNLDVYVNRNWVGRLDVRFAASAPDASALPCVTEDLLNRMGLAVANSDAAARLKSPGACVQLSELIPGATLTLDLPDLRLDASIPQAYMSQMPRGYVNPASWDAGVPAFLLNYNFNTYHATSAGVGQTSTYLGLRAGFNAGLWQLRQDSTVIWNSGFAGQPGQRHWHNIDAYAQRALPSMRAKITLGDSFTDGAVFDSFGLRGVQFATDDQMLPQSLRGYAPVVRGVADTNAKVTIRQNGVQLYETTVAPGPFVIRDLYPTGYGGDLVVTVTEADGRQHSFSVPYASVAQLLRPGVTRFDVAAGQLRSDILQDRPGVIQAAVQHGFDNVFTGYAGAQGSVGYAAVLVGGAFNTRIGAIAMDITQAHASIPRYGTHDGQSFRITYSKILPDTDTSLTVAAYRYSTSGFLSLLDAESARDYARRGLDALQYLPGNVPMVDGVPLESVLTAAQRAALAGSMYDTNNAFTAHGLLQQRNRFTLTLSQRLGQSGSLYANASVNDYWNRNGSDSQFQVGYNNHFRRLSWGVSATRSRLVFGGYDNQFFLNASLPLGDGTHAPNVSVNLSHSDELGSQEQAMLNGSAGQWNQFTYGATASRSDAGGGAAVSVNAGYRSPYAVFNASVGKGDGYSQQSASASGALVAHRGGVTFGQPMGDTVALVHVPGAGGAHITNAPGVRVDRFGYALVPYLMPYQLDTIQVDPKGLPLNVQLDATSARVAPYAGAVVMVDFKSKQGRALIVRIHLSDGKPAPFGAQVFNAKGEALGVVGQAGLALLRGVDGSGHLDVQWQGLDDIARSCSFAYALSEANQTASASTYRKIKATCVANVPAQTSGGDGP
jgi:outer membrane usher protein